MVLHRCIIVNNAIRILLYNLYDIRKSPSVIYERRIIKCDAILILYSFGRILKKKKKGLFISCYSSYLLVVIRSLCTDSPI